MYGCAVIALCCESKRGKGELGRLQCSDPAEEESGREAHKVELTVRCEEALREALDVSASIACYDVI